MSTDKRVWVNVYKEEPGKPVLIAEPVEFMVDDFDKWSGGDRTWAEPVIPNPAFQNFLVYKSWCHETREAAILAHVQRLCDAREVVAAEMTKWLGALHEIETLRQSLQATLEIEDMVSPPDASRP